MIINQSRMKKFTISLFLMLVSLATWASEIILIEEIDYKINLPKQWCIENIDSCKLKFYDSTNSSTFFFVEWNQLTDNSVNYVSTFSTSTTNNKRKKLRISTKNGIRYKRVRTIRYNYHRSFLKGDYLINITCNVTDITKKQKMQIEKIISELD